MPQFDESFLKRFFLDYPSQSLTTNAKFWTLPDIPVYQTLHLSGDVSLTLNGATQKYPDGAFVFKKADGSLGALPHSSAWGGGITVDGSAVRTAKLDFMTNRTVGNMASVEVNEQLKRLTVRMPEGQTGTSFSYPAPTSKELAAAAEAKNLVIQARSGDKIIEGFFVEGKGGVLPTTFQAYNNGISIKGGEFISIHREANGEVRGLFAYKPYSPEDLRQFTQQGRYAAPGNDVKDLMTLDRKPLLAESQPRLNVESGKGIFPRGFTPEKIDLALLREQLINESARAVPLQQKLAQDFPHLYSSKVLDVTQARVNAERLFDQNAGSAWGQRKLVAETDSLISRNNTLAISIAEKAGLPLSQSELSTLKLSTELAPKSESMLSRVAAYLPESKLTRALFGTGKAALGMAGAIAVTELAIKGIELAANKIDLARNQKPDEAKTELAIDFSTMSDSRQNHTVLKHAKFDELLQKSAKDQIDIKAAPAENPRA